MEKLNFNSQHEFIKNQIDKSFELTPEEKWERATLANNFIFYKVMRHHPEVCKEILELLLNIKIDRINIHNEETIDVDFNSKGVRLDLYVTGSDKVFDIEVQTTNTGELPERARYYQGIMDVDTLATGASYDKLKESHVIFLCMQDPFAKLKKNLPVYTFENICKEDMTIFLDDRTYKHFFIVPNCAKMIKDKELKSFFSLLAENKSESALTNRLKSFVDAAKQNSQWRMQFMTWEQQKALEYRLGQENGSLQKAIEAATNLLKMNLLSPEQIAQAIALPLEKVLELQKEISVDE